MSTSAMMRRLATENTLPPDVDGMGYKTNHIQGGAGFSYTRYASKQMDSKMGSKVWVSLVESVPSPFDPATKGINSKYSVFLGTTDKGEELDCPFECPVPATCWAPDGECDWYADFGDDGAAAEAFACEPVSQSERLARKLLITDEQLSLYFMPEEEGGLLEEARAMLSEQDQQDSVQSPVRERQR
jgi:hypothetical protein